MFDRRALLGLPRRLRPSGAARSCGTRLLTSAAITLLVDGMGTGWPAELVVPDAFGTIQSALDRATSGDSILVRPGVYREALILAGKDVTVLGRYGSERDGTSFSAQSDGDPGGDRTVLDGDGARRILRIGSGVTSATLFGDLQFEHGRSDSGAAIQAQSGGSAVFVRCIFADNEAITGSRGLLGAGGAMYVGTASDIVLEDCLFQDNVARIESGTLAHEGQGGAIFSEGLGWIRARRSVFRRNTSLSGPEGGPGGACFLRFGTDARFEDCSFEGNFAFAGGAIRAYGDLTLRRCTFERNVGTHGPVVAVFGDRLLIEECVFFDNDTTSGGAAIGADGASTIRHNTIAFNVRCKGIVLGEGEISVHHNLVVWNGSAGIDCATPTAVLSCNDVWGNFSGATPAEYAGLCWDRNGSRGNIGVDPLFCDVPARDLRLHANSEAANSAECGRIGAMPVGCPSTPALLSDLHASDSRDGVLLRWTLGRETLDQITAVEAQRAARADGPYAGLDVALLPAVAMQVLDPELPPGGEAWYRVQVRLQGGSSLLSSPVRVVRGRGVTRSVLESALERPDGSLEIRFRVAGGAQRAGLDIFDVQGHLVRHIDLGIVDAGAHRVTWNRLDRSGARAARGSYLLRFETPTGDGAGRALLLRD